MPRPAIAVRRILTAVLLLLALGVAHASEDLLTLELPGLADFELERYGAGGGPLLLWLPSERGFNPSYRTHARKLADFGFEVWLADLHDAYFVERNRRSIGKFPLDDVVALIEQATRMTDARVVLISASRGAQLALIAAREWQLKNPSTDRLAGAVLLHAHLHAKRPAIGETASYLPIAAATNLPVFLLDAQYSTKSARQAELASALSAGGSQVYQQIVADVQGGYFARDESDLSDADREARREFARSLQRAVNLLLLAPAPRVAATSGADTRRFSSFSARAAGLSRLEPPLSAPPVVLEDYARTEYRLEAQRGRVILLNFWASWCKPCVDEIPSLHRLAHELNHPDFDVVTVNVGESRARIDAFLRRVPIELPLLLDLDSRAAADWRVYVYPSSYLVDRDGQIRYAYLGALEWDSTSNIDIIQKLLRKP